MALRKLKRNKVNGYEYIRKDAEWLESPAYRNLRPLARCLLEEFLIIYRPSRNGQLSISTDQASKRLGVTENTILSPYYDLVEHGFLVLVRGELWIARKAREWCLTMMPYNGHEPTDEWRQWQLGKPVRSIRRNKKSRS